MNVIVFASTDYQQTPWDQWTQELDINFFILTPKRFRRSYAKFSNVYPFPRYWSNQNVDLVALEIARKNKIDFILAKDEWDLMRAARIRDLLQISGQSIAQAVAYRNKLVMKDLLGKGGVPIAHYRPVDHVYQIVDFAKQFGYPVVIKPIDGVSGSFTTVLRSPSDLQDYVTTGLASGLMVESFVDGEMYHVDGLCIDSQIKFAYSSKYINSCLSYQKNEYSGSKSLSNEDTLSRRLVAFTSDIIKSLPPIGNSAFHCEIFVTPQDNLVCCEIACRTGGGRIVEQTELEFGINLDREWVRSQLNLEINLPPKGQSPNRRHYGHIFVPRSVRGQLSKSPRLGQIPWATKEKLFVEPGVHYDDDIGRRQNLASAIVFADDASKIESHLREWNQWISDQADWVESP